MYTTQEFAQKIKMKYPQYQGIEDTELVNKIVSKYPQYKSQVNMEEPGFFKSLTNTAMEFGSEVYGGVKSAVKDIYA